MRVPGNALSLIGSSELLPDNSARKRALTENTVLLFRLNETRFPIMILLDSIIIIEYLYKEYVIETTLNLDSAFSALADPTRRAILARLAKGEATVNELSEPFEMTQPAISQHLKVLEEAGLIVRRVDGTRRPRRLVKDGIEAMDQWLAMLRKALEENYGRLDHVLAAMERKEKGKL